MMTILVPSHSMVVSVRSTRNTCGLPRYNKALGCKVPYRDYKVLYRGLPKVQVAELFRLRQVGDNLTPESLHIYVLRICVSCNS